MMQKRVDYEKLMIEHFIKRAPESADRAEDVLEMFCDAVDGGVAPNRRILDYLAGCFRKVLKGCDAAKVLNLKQRSAGQRRARTLNKNDERNIDLTRAVIRHMKHDMTKVKAIEAVAESKGVGSYTVKAAYDEFGRHVRSTEP